MKGGAGDGQYWVEQAETSAEEEWRRGRPAKHHRSSSRKWEGQSTNPSPLQDSKGRHEEVQQLYQHAGEHTLARHDVAAQEWPTTTLIWSWVQQRVSTTRYSA